MNRISQTIHVFANPLFMASNVWQLVLYTCLWLSNRNCEFSSDSLNDILNINIDLYISDNSLLRIYINYLAKRRQLNNRTEFCSVLQLTSNTELYKTIHRSQAIHPLQGIGAASQGSVCVQSSRISGIEFTTVCEEGSIRLTTGMDNVLIFVHTCNIMQ